MSENMNDKYQQYYNQLLTGTLTETLLKGISYQANIKLANEIIAEQEKSIQTLQESETTLKDELTAVKTSKLSSENSKISTLESTVSKLQADLYEMNKLKAEYENVKHQVQHLDTYRNEIVKANEKIKNMQDDHSKVVSNFELKIKSLNDEINVLKTPAPAKKSKVKKTTEVVTTSKAKIIKQNLPGLIVKDGGSF